MNKRSTETVTCNFDDVVAETDKAWLFYHKDTSTEVWLPKSQIETPDDLEVGDRGVDITLPLWLAREKGLD